MDEVMADILGWNRVTILYRYNCLQFFLIIHAHIEKVLHKKSAPYGGLFIFFVILMYLVAEHVRGGESHFGKKEADGVEASGEFFVGDAI